MYYLIQLWKGGKNTQKYFPYGHQHLKDKFDLANIWLLSMLYTHSNKSIYMNSMLPNNHRTDCASNET